MPDLFYPNAPYRRGRYRGPRGWSGRPAGGEWWQSAPAGAVRDKLSRQVQPGSG
ncbi:hypothetical protein NKI12_03465 [Mesorhizobium australicum]|uniref:Uncharacterized protein n=1 Tax=Mesorhizobium australicum TaxID=536018 RepID=A0ACC6SV04_9HYPH